MENKRKAIVRLLRYDLDGNKKMWQALLGIKGIGKQFSTVVCKVFSEVTGKDWKTTYLGDLNENDLSILEDIILNPDKYKIPSWLYNTRKEYYTGKDLHLVGVDLDRKETLTVERLFNIRSYRGVRLKAGLKVRGQRTKSHPRKNKKSKVGKVQKKS